MAPRASGGSTVGDEEDAPPSSGRQRGLFDTTAVGVGAILGGGIFVLVGLALQASGPGAIAAFALNGTLAFMAAMSFAEMSTAFPSSGGPYVFAQRVLGVRAAFAAGWVLWFAYIVAAALYAIGFAEFAVATVAAVADHLPASLAPLAAPTGTGWLSRRGIVVAIAMAATGAYTLSLARTSGGGGQAATVGKVVVFVVIVVTGLAQLLRRPVAVVADDLSPFLSGGALGLLQAMGVTFVALQGFDLVAAVAGEVKQPRRNIPRAMFFSLSIALAVYLPLLLVVATVGTPPGVSIQAMAVAEPATVMATAVERYLGRVGFWLVMLAAILSTLSALLANLLAASRVAVTMAQDRTLPSALARRHPRRGTPVVAVYATFVAVGVVLVALPNLAQVGAAASLIFLLTFAVVHGTSFLARRRGSDPHAFRSPAFPLVPLVGGGACLAMAALQVLTVPAAAEILALWLALGGLLYASVFSSNAEALDAFAQALDPSLTQQRGQVARVLVPVANPRSAAGLVAMGHALAPGEAGRVLVLRVVTPSDDEDAARGALDAAHSVLDEALRTAWRSGHRPDVLLKSSHDPWSVIPEVAAHQRCDQVVLGLDSLDATGGARLTGMLSRLASEVLVVRAPETFRLERIRHVLIPVAGRGDQDRVRARIIGALTRAAPELTLHFVVVAPPHEGSGDDRSAAANTSLPSWAKSLGTQLSSTRIETEVIYRDDVIGALIERSHAADLVILGLQSTDDGGRRIGRTSHRIALESRAATLLIGTRAAPSRPKLSRPDRDPAAPASPPPERDEPEKRGQARVGHDHVERARDGTMKLERDVAGEPGGHAGEGHHGGAVDAGASKEGGESEHRGAHQHPEGHALAAADQERDALAGRVSDMVVQRPESGQGRREDAGHEQSPGRREGGPGQMKRP
ncbi:MAG: amino acid permease [Myxococcota bacterium]